VHGDERLTYRELDARANRLAHRLRAAGVVRGARVGLAVERSLDMVVAALAILRAGGAYVPLDPHHPVERLAAALRDSGAALVLTQTHLRDRVPGPPALCLDAEGPALGFLPGAPPPAAAGPDDVAYVIHTSGSTGRPKGVQVPHRALANFLASMAAAPGLGPD